MDVGRGIDHGEAVTLRGSVTRNIGDGESGIDFSSEPSFNRLLPRRLHGESVVYLHERKHLGTPNRHLRYAPDFNVYCLAPVELFSAAVDEDAEGAILAGNVG